jgi:putative SOS response-associated peptidase YedK
MCGRYASARKRQELLEEFLVRREHADQELPPDYNVAPTKRVYAVLTRSSQHPERPVGRGKPASGPGQDQEASGTSRGARHGEHRGPGPAQGASTATIGAASDSEGAGTAAQPARQLRVLRWGLVPSWAKDPAIGSRLINARAETVAEKPSFRRAFARRRCLLPADGYYEWQAADPDSQSAAASATVPPGQLGPPAPKARAGKRATRKVPYYIHPRDGGVLALAGLYELWRRPVDGSGDAAGGAPDDGDSWLWTVTIITTRAVDELGRIHDRMPMVIERSLWADWLDPGLTDPGDVRELMVPAASGGLDVFPVSPAVNNVRNNGPGLIEPAPAEVISPGNGATGSPGSLL